MNFFLRLLTALFNLFSSRSSGSSGTTKPRWLTFAEAEVGFHEVGNNLGIERYISDAKCGHLGDPWCAIFVNAMLERAGYRGTRSAAARSFERDVNFVKLSGPALGAITTMWRGSPTAGTGHVFFYIGENFATRYNYALGGNQDDQVCRQFEPVSRIVGYYWPTKAPLPVIGPVYVDSKGKSIVTKET